MKLSQLVAALLAAPLLPTASPYSVPTFATRRGTMTMRKGRPSLRKTVGSSKPIKPMGGGGEDGGAAPRSANWVPVAGISSLSDLPTEEGKVKLVDTMAAQLINGATNPTGAVSVVKFKGRTYCVSSSCAGCKIPLTKARVLEPNEETGSDPRIACDFCSATYNVRTGKRVKDAQAAGFVGGIVKGLMSANQQKEDLPAYDLGERDGKVLINLP